MGSAEAPTRTSTYHISFQRICLMMVLSYGLYLFYWFYLTWKQYRDHTGNEAYPVWHALSVAVPIYGLFRTHFHMRSFKELMVNADVSSTIGIGWVVALVLVSWVLNSASVVLSGGLPGLVQVTKQTSVVGAIIGVISVSIACGLLLHVQSNLSRYWGSLPGTRLVGQRVDASEIVLAIIGALTWFSVFVSLVSPAYRTGF